MMKILRSRYGKKEAADIMTRHRETHITKSDFERIRGCGLNAVRLPFGYWVVLGPAANELYVGPALEYIDRAVDWAEECGLQIVLDLHGCPGGESGEAPCGRRQRPHGTWHWRQWRFSQSLEALKVLAQRYCSRKCVTGIAVCNEPSNTVPLTALCRYYDRAVDVIRSSGMSEKDVAVALPIFQRPEDVVIEKWEAFTGGRHRNICFDVHCYHCFENEFNGKTFAQQLRAVEDNAAMLRQYPMVVGEWSLALGVATWSTCGNMSDESVYRLFARAQVEAFKEASHGSFFWNWTEAGDALEWNYQLAQKQGIISSVASVRLPRWKGSGEDPLEEKLHPSPSEPRVLLGDALFFRAFHGRYLDVEGAEVSARWPDKGKWQELTLVAPDAKLPKQEVRDGDVVRLRTKSGRYLSVDEEGGVTAVEGRFRSSAMTEFIVHVEGARVLKHRGYVYLEHQATGRVLDADEEEECISARWCDFGIWQRLAAEKSIMHEAHTPKKSRGEGLFAGHSPVKRRAPPLSLPSSEASELETLKRRRTSYKLSATQAGPAMAALPFPRMVRVR